MDTLDFRLLNEFQKDFPRCERPYLAVAERLESTEGTVLQRLGSLLAGGAISRIGGVFGANRVGASTLAAMAVPPEELESVARRVSALFLPSITTTNGNIATTCGLSSPPATPGLWRPAWGASRPRPAIR